MIRLCSGFPPGWPADYRERFIAAHALHWPSSIALDADDFLVGGLDGAQLILPADIAADMADGDLLAWLDPDIETMSAVPSFVIPQLIKGADLCFIGREDGQTDLTFWAVRLSGPVRAFLTDLADRATGGAPAGVAWAGARADAALVERDLTPGGSGDFWPHGPLGRYTRRLPRPA